MVQVIIGFFFFLLHDQHYFMSKKSCLILNNFSYYIHCNGHDFLNINRSPLPLLIGLTTVCPRSLVPFYKVTYHMEWAKTYWTYAKTVFETLRDRKKMENFYILMTIYSFVCITIQPFHPLNYPLCQPSSQPCTRMVDAIYLSHGYLITHIFSLSLVQVGLSSCAHTKLLKRAASQQQRA